MRLGIAHGLGRHHVSKLKGKVALVTGGSRGIGAAVAKRLAADGARVALSYSASPDAANAVVAEITEAGDEAVAMKADAGSVEETRALVDQTAEQFGGLDILVNNAGIYRMGTVYSAPLEDLERTYAVNVRGPFVAVQAAMKHMRDGGRIITIGSINGQRALMAGMGLYVMSKFAVAGLSQGWAHDLGARNITSNIVAPGPIDTDMNPADSDMAKALTPMVPLKRYGTGDEVAATVAFLASDEASYVTGATLVVDGGVIA